MGRKEAGAVQMETVHDYLTAAGDTSQAVLMSAPNTCQSPAAALAMTSAPTQGAINPHKSPFSALVNREHLTRASAFKDEAHFSVRYLYQQAKLRFEISCEISPLCHLPMNKCHCHRAPVLPRGYPSRCFNTNQYIQQ